MKRIRALSIAISVALMLNAAAPCMSYNVLAAGAETEIPASSGSEAYDMPGDITSEMKETEYTEENESSENKIDTSFISEETGDYKESTPSEETVYVNEDFSYEMTNLSSLDINLMSEEETEDSSEDSSEDGTAGVIYSTHVQSIGWQEYVNDGKTAGTTGQSKRVEAIRIELVNTTGLTGSIEYSAHVQSIGWQGYVSDSAIAGTTGQAKRMEAVKIRLTGELAEKYSIYYRVHIAKAGWLSWTCDDGIAGSVGLSKQIEAIEIKIVDKKAAVSEYPTVDGGSYLKSFSDSDFTYYTHVQSIGNMPAVKNGQISGTTGQAKRVEGIVLNLNQAGEGAISGDIQYRTHIQGIGWQEWKSLGSYSGTIGQAKRAEAIEIRLTGQLALLYDIYYSAHVEKYGWLGWAKNGQTAGTTGIAYRMEALKIKLVVKDSAAPGSNSGYYKNTPATAYPAMYYKAQSKTSATSWLIMVDTKLCKVGVYSGSKGSWKQIYYWSCTPGADETPTVLGEYTVTARGLKFGHGYTCWYYTQFYGDYLFHSIIYNEGSMTSIQDPTLGVRASHGCIRLAIENAKWIYDNIPLNTKVVIYE